MKRFLFSLLSGDETGINSIITCGVGSLVVHFGMTIYTVIHDPASWNAMNFALAAAAIVGIVSGGKTLHDGVKTALSNAQPSA